MKSFKEFDIIILFSKIYNNLRIIFIKKPAQNRTGFL